MNQLMDYIEQARKKGLDDEAIKNNMIVAGWDANMVDAGLKAKMDDLPVPPPPAPTTQSSSSNEPVAVVHNLSTRGFEYVIMFLAMGISATALGFLLHDTLNSYMGYAGDSYGGFIAYGTAALVVALPVFAVLFLRLKKAELADKTLLNDPSRRRAIQLTLIITFLIGVFNLIGYIYSLMNAGTGNRDYYSSYGSTSGSVASDATLNLLHTLITLAIAGGIFAYYWIDSHRKEK